jgi:hypothetical protein
MPDNVLPLTVPLPLLHVAPVNVQFDGVEPSVTEYGPPPSFVGLTSR